MGNPGYKSKRRLSILLALVALALAAGGLWTVRANGLLPGWPNEKSASRPGPTVVAQGKALYASNCAQCHGADAEGQPNWRQQNPDRTYPAPPHDSTGHTWHHADGLVYRTVRDGGKLYEHPGFKSAMPPFEASLRPEEIRAVITYLKTLWGPEERALQAQASLQDPFP